LSGADIRPLPALLYHAVGKPPADADPEARRLFVHPERFSCQMMSLAKRGFRTVSLQEYATVLGGQEVGGKRLLITFDDAYAHLQEVVTPILRQHRFTAVVFVPWQHVGSKNTWDAKEHPSLSTIEVATADQLRRMVAGPWEVASHGMCHVDLRTLESQQRRAQLRAAREGLSELLRRPVHELAYPYGSNDEAVRADARAAGYRLAFVANSRPSKDQFQLPRRAISGSDGQLLFWLKTSARSELVYGTRRLTRKVNKRRPSAVRNVR
jgi:peptidoglycan/xylan/chitin deacetylase (PgdA/CDA1 family)